MKFDFYLKRLYQITNDCFTFYISSFNRYYCYIILVSLGTYLIDVINFFMAYHFNHNHSNLIDYNHLKFLYHVHFNNIYFYNSFMFLNPFINYLLRLSCFM